jgi:uncharacterized phage protein gp47/JayE
VQAMLNRVPSKVDKREGSIIYDAVAPCAYFLTQQDFQLENFVDLVLADTAVGEYLDRAVWPHVTRKEATPAVRIMETSGEVAVGTRWGIQSLVYVVIERLSETECRVECETAGIIGNQYSGDMQPISPVVGVTATLGDVITPGTEREEDEALRERFYQKVQRPVTSGNAYQYRSWALEVPGVGDAKAFPIDNGPGTVTVLVLDDDRNIDTSLESVVMDYIEDNRPIGADVTVSSPTTLFVNVTVNVLLDGRVTKDTVLSTFKAELDVYLKSLIKENYAQPVKYVKNSYRVSLAKIGNILINIDGVEDYDVLRLNDGGNVQVGAKEIPVVGIVTLSEVSSIGTD